MEINSPPMQLNLIDSSWYFAMNKRLQSARNEMRQNVPDLKLVDFIVDRIKNGENVIIQMGRGYKMTFLSSLIKCRLNELGIKPIEITGSVGMGGFPNRKLSGDEIIHEYNPFYREFIESRL